MLLKAFVNIHGRPEGSSIKSTVLEVLSPEKLEAYGNRNTKKHQVAVKRATAGQQRQGGKSLTLPPLWGNPKRGGTSDVGTALTDEPCASALCTVDEEYCCLRLQNGAERGRLAVRFLA